MASFEDLFPEYGTRGRSEGLHAVAEVVEVAGAGFVIGALEQRYGEQKMTVWMDDDTNPDGSVKKNADGSNMKKSGTGVPLSAVVGGLGLVAAVFVPRVTMGMRRHVLNISTGLLSAFSYRKGIEKGQAWLDSEQPAGSTKQAAPVPPFAQSATALAEIANVKGEDDVDSNVESFDRAAAAVRAQRAAGHGR